MNYLAVSPEGSYFTHVSYETCEKLHVKKGKEVSFWRSYCNAVDNEESLFIGEILGDSSQVIVIANKDTPFDKETIVDICKAYRTVIDDYYNLENGPDDLQIAVLSGDDGCYLRIHFPFAHVQVSKQKYITEGAIAELEKIRDLDWKEILTPLDVGMAVPIYGSSEPDGINIECDLIYYWIQPDIFPDEWESIMTCDINNHANSDLTGWEDLTRNYIVPIILSVQYHEYLLEEKPKSMRKLAKKIRKNASFEDIDNIYSYKMYNRMIKMTDKIRYITFRYWTDFGKALKHCSENDKDELEKPKEEQMDPMLLWMKNTKNALRDVETHRIPAFLSVYRTYREAKNNLPKREVRRLKGKITEHFENIWETFVESDGITNRTVAWYAQEDSPIEYKNWNREWFMTGVKNSVIKFTHTAMSIAAFRYMWLLYAYDDGDWYIFRRGIWKRVRTNKDISIDLSISVSSEYTRYIEELASKMDLLPASDSKRDSYISLINIATKARDSLEDVRYKRNLITELEDRFNINEFSKKLNKDQNLTGCQNGIIDVSTGVAMFRSSKPEDYISKRMGATFDQSLHENHPKVKELLTWFSEVYTDSDVYNHMLKFSASCLKARNSDKIFPIWSGSGNNSKSMVGKLFELTLGDYMGKINPTILSEKPQNSGGATPQLAAAEDCRLLVADEPEDDGAEMNKGAIKKWTGDDSVVSRQLYKESKFFIMTFVLMLICNNIPNLVDLDEAVMSRICVFPHTSKWVFDAPKSREEQFRTRTFQRDGSFGERIHTLKNAFLWIMVKYYSIYNIETLKEQPESMRKATAEYIEQNDMYGIFIKDRVEEYNGSVTGDEMYSEFRAWFRDNKKKDKIPPESLVVKREIAKRLGSESRSIFTGYRLSSTKSKSF